MEITLARAKVKSSGRIGSFLIEFRVWLGVSLVQNTMHGRKRLGASMKALRIVSMMNFVYTYCMLPITAMSERRREVSVLDFWNEFSISFMELWLGPFFLDRMEVAETLPNAFAFALLGSFSELHSVDFTRPSRFCHAERKVSALYYHRIYTPTATSNCVIRYRFLKCIKLCHYEKFKSLLR